MLKSDLEILAPNTASTNANSHEKHCHVLQVLVQQHSYCFWPLPFEFYKIAQTKEWTACKHGLTIALAEIS